MQYSTSPSATDQPLNLAMIPAELQNLIFVVSLIASAGLVFFLLIRRFPVLSEALNDLKLQIQSFLNPQRREARLHKVICHHCRRGMGVYNPIYRTYDGISYIEGTCTHCGTYIKARLR